jgi:hypothetical protein
VSGASLHLGNLPHLAPTTTKSGECYPVNSDWGLYSHEGDWAFVTAVVYCEAGKYTVEFIYWAHGDDNYPTAYNSRGAASVTDLKRPVVYSAWHSHECYVDAGNHDLSSTNLSHDVTADGGAVWATGDHLKLIQEGSPYWIDFKGDWGSDTETPSSIPGQPARKGGPSGPNMKSPGWLTTAPVAGIVL